MNTSDPAELLGLTTAVLGFQSFGISGFCPSTFGGSCVATGTAFALLAFLLLPVTTLLVCTDSTAVSVHTWSFSGWPLNPDTYR